MIIIRSSNNTKIYDPHLRVPGALEFAGPKQQSPTSFFKKWGFGVYSIAASVSNRVLTRLDVIRYQLAVIGLRYNLNQKDEGDMLFLSCFPPVGLLFFFNRKSDFFLRLFIRF